MPTLATCSFAETLTRRLERPESPADPTLGEHVRSCPECRRRIADSVRNSSGDPLSAWLSSSEEGLTGYQAEAVVLNRTASLKLGPYLLVEKLGAGGMGEVFRAWHTLLRRFDGVKRIRPEHADGETAIRRFLREAEAAAGLRHPNVVAVYSADRAESGYFLAMEYVPGTDLGRLVQQQGPLPIGTACAYAIQAARGLQHALDQGFIHRDIKPANLLVTADRQTVKVADFGLARAVRPTAGPGEELTGQGGLLGTYDYMSPEQAEDPRTADTRSDLYSLGCTLNFLLTSSVVFPGGSFIDKLARHASSVPRNVRSLRPEIPAGLAEIVRKLLAKKPDHRYQTPRELAEALAPFAADSSDIAPSPATKVLPDTPTVVWNPSANSTSNFTPGTKADPSHAPHRRPASWKRFVGRSALALLAVYAFVLIAYFAFMALFGKDADQTYRPQSDLKSPVKAPNDPPDAPKPEPADPVPPQAGESGPWKAAGPFRSPRADIVRFLGLSKSRRVVAAYEGTGNDGSESGFTVIWDAVGGEPVRSFRPAGSEPYESPVGFDPNGEYLVTSRLRKIGLEDGAEVGTFSPVLDKVENIRAESIDSLAFAGNGRYAVGGATRLGSAKRYFVEWELESFGVRTALEIVAVEPLRAVATDGGGRKFAAGTCLGKIITSDVAVGTGRTWEVKSGEPPTPDFVTAIAFDGSGATLFSAHAKAGSIFLWDYETGLAKGSPLALGGQIYRLVVSPDGRWLAAAGSALTVWDLKAEPWKQYELVASGPYEFQALAFDPSSRRVAAGGYYKAGEDIPAVGAVSVWDLKP